MSEDSSDSSAKRPKLDVSDDDSAAKRPKLADSDENSASDSSKSEKLPQVIDLNFVRES